MEFNIKPCFVYVLCDAIGIKYVGVSIRPNVRFKAHFTEAFDTRSYKYNYPKCRWIRKYSSDIRMRVVYSGTEEDCYLKEIDIISKLRLKGKVIYNITSGGDKPPKINELPNFENIKLKIKSKAVGRVISKETRLKMSIVKKGIKASWLPDDVKGCLNPNSKRIYQYTESGELVNIFSTLKEAAAYCNVTSGTFSERIRTNQNYKNYIWFYENKQGTKTVYLPCQQH